MITYEYRSCVGPQIEEFVRVRRAAGAICDGYVRKLGQFDGRTADAFPSAERLTQEMVDRWFERRDTESARSCVQRCLPVAALVGFLRSRGETDVVVPETPRRDHSGYVPHIFTDDELRLFFGACDSWDTGRHIPREVRLRTKRTLPVFFRLLYSAGLRPVEARKLRRENVDLGSGTLMIVEGKGRNERLVALHPSMTEVMSRYDPLMEGMYPGRRYFFPRCADGRLSVSWVNYHFSRIWSGVSSERATPYALRHAYATRNIDAIERGGAEGLEDLEYLSKSMGHHSVEETVGSYYHITPGLAEALQERCGDALGDVIPEVIR